MSFSATNGLRYSRCCTALVLVRRGEIERLNIDSFDRSEGTLRIDGRKTGRERCVAVPEVLWRCLESYLPQRHNVLERAAGLGQQALLVNRRGKRLTGQMISNGIHAMAQRAQIGLVSMHQFRHSCASDLLETGVHLPEVQRILGHQAIATTVRIPISLTLNGARPWLATH